MRELVALDRAALLALLQEVAEGHVAPEDAVERLAVLPYEDLGYVKIDHHRSLRLGFPEVVFCQGKTPEQVVDILLHLKNEEKMVMASRAGPEVYERVREAIPEARYHALARIIVVGQPPERAAGAGTVAVVSAGTADLPVAEEAAVTLEVLGNPVERIYDVGVAGLHRLLARLPDLQRARVLVVAAGMEGALPSVVAGLVARPVVAVPTSIGYGASFGGLAALLTMLNSCAPGIGVVNIDNGFGAARLAHLINCAPIPRGKERE